MPKNSQRGLSRRERQIMDVIYQRGQATAADVEEGLSDPPSYSAVRALLAILVNKGLLKIEQDGPRYVYHPRQPRQQVGRSAIKQVMETFFEGSVEFAVAALLDSKRNGLSESEVERLKSLIEHARKDGK